MALDFLYIISGIFMAIIFSGGIYLIYLKSREGEEPENETLIINFSPQYSDGHAFGIQRNIEFGENKVKITFSPRDINYIRELKKGRGSSNEYTVYYYRNQVLPLPISAHRNILICFPDNPSLIPEELKKERFGKAIIYMMNKNNIMKDESNLNKSRMEKLQEISLETFGGKIYTDFVEKTKIQMKDMAESSKEREKKIGEKHEK